VTSRSRSTETGLDALARYGERVLLLTYEQLVLDTEATMDLVARRIGITMSALLFQPTFNRRPILANSSDSVARYGVLPERVDAYRHSLDGETAGRIAELAGDVYTRAVAAAAR
jgi:hypothetical protein